MSCRTEYQNRLEARQQESGWLARRDDWVVNLRVVVFVAGLATLWAVLGRWQLTAWLLLLPLGMFAGVVVYHESVKRKQSVFRRAIEFYERCLKRLDGHWPEWGPTGEEFVEPQHRYADDLDLFGKGSLFQLLGSPVTPAGARTLAGWLAPGEDIKMPSADVVILRQEAVRSLGGQLGLREQLAVIGRSTQTQDHSQELPKWLATAGGLTAKWISAVAFVLGMAGVTALIFWFVSKSIALLILVVLLQLAFLRMFRIPLGGIKQYSDKAVMELRRVEQVLATLENVEGEDAEVKRLRGTLIHAGMRGSVAIGRLERLVSQFENTRRNVFIAPLAFVSMGSFLLACAIDRWRTKHLQDVERWFKAVGELEALLALAQLHYENSEYCFPQFVDSPPQFVATKLAHPLLPQHTAVANDVELSGNARMLLVSGSNMSGKSTLLRSVGINAALAWAGAPVCAESLRLSRLRVACAMRAQDSLQAGTSHFMATLQRIRLVVELAEQATPDTAPVLFLLDEILHGTNSHDRIVGARGVIHSLLETGAVGLVTTHDLALSEVVDDLECPTRNVHFRDEWKDGEMVFDYQMHEGVVPKSNALSLMRLLGLEV